MSIYNRNEPEPGEWQTDPKTGERFRMIGHIKEYETVTYISGIPVPQSQIADFHKRQKEAEERRKAAAAEEWKTAQSLKAARFRVEIITLVSVKNAAFSLKANALLLFWQTHTGQNRQSRQNRHRPQNARLAFTDAVRAAPCLIMAAPL